MALYRLMSGPDYDGHIRKHRFIDLRPRVVVLATIQDTVAVRVAVEVGHTADAVHIVSAVVHATRVVPGVEG